MTSAQTDNVMQPDWLIASAVLQQISHVMFETAVKDFKQRYPDGPAFDPPGLRIWRNLRRFGELYIQMRTVRFQPHEAAALDEALAYAHRFYHENITSAGPVRTSEHCFCPVAFNMRELADITAKAYETEVLE